MLNKNLVVLVGLAVLAGLVAERRWELLRTPWLLAGVALALAIAAPNLLWQADRGWPQLEMAEAISDRIGAENRATLVPFQVLYVGPPLALMLWLGARWLAGTARMRPLLWAWPAVLLVVLATGGRPYYALPLTATVLLAGVVAAERARWLPYGDFRRPDDDRATVVAVRYRAERLAPLFDRCAQVATVSNDAGVDNEVQGAPIVVCRGLRVRWAEAWERLRHLS